MRTIRNVFRRRLRAALTIFGITIGVFALVVMGAMAEKITLLVNGGTRFYSDKVTLSQKAPGGFATSPLLISKARELESMAEVNVASADIQMTLDEEAGASFGLPDFLVASDLRGEPYESFKIGYTEGRKLAADDVGKAVIGSDMVNKLQAHVGDQVTVRGRQFEVIGVLDKTFTIPDNSVSISMTDAQDIFFQSLPDIVRANLDQQQLATGITVYPKPGIDPNQLAQEIKDRYPDYEAIGPAKFEEQVTSSTRIFTTIVFGVAIISLLVCGLSVINTMTMSVFERTREIGIRKSLGASNARIIRQFLGESAFIGLTGGMTGLALGWLFILVANAAGESSGTVIFLLTSRLAAGSVLFAVFLGLLSGLYPSWHAARMNPVEALRYE